ncbi:myb/SANT-like domain-containing protein [Artemisia annua]|uniref:Myb/SANT-like domain-containing protein n=1 Tax=Artemisia annua TaxID=35608 RepID=A0A2U1PS01_ARTAN|nr:myb/SANT-like domain-containing protein [Artemisia annua]
MNKKLNKKVNNATNFKREFVSWTAEMDDEFIRVMLLEKEKGNRIGGTFTSQAHANMVEELNRTLKLNLSQKNLQNRLRTIREHFALCYDVFCGTTLSGFSWNPISELIEAEEEVWKALIEANPEASIWKAKTISNYDDLYELFSKDRTTGGGAETAKERRKRTNRNVESTNEIDLDDSEGIDDIEITTVTPPSQIKPKRTKKKKVEEESEFVSKIMGSFECVSNAMKECTKAIVGSRPQVYSGAEVYAELKCMRFEKDALARAFVFLDATEAMEVDEPEAALTISSERDATEVMEVDEPEAALTISSERCVPYFISIKCKAIVSNTVHHCYDNG